MDRDAPPQRPIEGETPRRRRLRRLATVGIGLLISAGFVVLALRDLDLGRVLAEARRVQLGTLALSVLGLFAGFGMMALRSDLLLRPIARFRRYRLFKAVLVGVAGNNVLPFRLGELLRIDYLARGGNVPHSACIAVVAIERLLDLLLVVAIFFALLPIVVIQLPNAALLAVVGAVVLAAVITLAVVARHAERLVSLCRWLSRPFGPRVADWVTAKAALFAEGLAALTSGRALAGVLLFSSAFWVTNGVTIWLWLAAFDIALPWYAPAVLVVFITFGTTLPASPGFIGTYHYFAMLALTLMGVEDNLAASFALVAHGTALVPPTLISILLLLGDIARGDLRRGPERSGPR